MISKKLTFWNYSNLNSKIPLSSILSKPFGVGRSAAKSIIAKFGLPQTSRLGSLSFFSREFLSIWLKKHAVVMRALYKIKSSRLAELSRFGSKKSLRRSMGLPVNGQRTRSNAQTVRRLLRFRKKMF